MTFEERISLGIYPSKKQLEELYTQKLNRAEICNLLNISVSTYKKLRRYYGLNPKTRVVDKSTYRVRVLKTQKTLNARYGLKGSETRNEFYRQNRKKQEDTCLSRYGVKDTSSLPHVIEKRKNTFLLRYGVDNPMKSSEIQLKAQQTDLHKYGCKYHINSSIIKQKSKESILERFGTTSFMKIPEVAEKRKKTNLQKYGYECCLSNPNIRQKGFETMSMNGTQAVLSSSQQQYIAKLFQGEVNYLIGPYHIDCFLLSNNIGIEYSGSGHDLSVRLGRETQAHFDSKEKARRAYFINHKIPILDFFSKTDKLPSDNKLFELLENAKNEFQQGILYYPIDLDNI